MKHLQIVLILFFLLFISFTSKSQDKERAIWYFGPNLGLNFNTGQLESDSNNQFNNLNSTSTIADEDGNLLFYTDGSRIFNKNHTVMPNGSSLAGARISIIVKVPEEETTYFIIGINDSGDMWVTTVDMTVNNGLGDVIVGGNSLVFQTGMAPKLTAVRHSNGNDIWLISHESASNRYVSMLVTKNGIGAPQRISIGRNYCDRSTINCGSLGMMKSSSNGGLIADPLPLFSEIQVISFDKTSGFMKEVYILETEPTLTAEKRSVSFSPNNRFLYEGSNQQISQFDLNAGDIQDVQISKLLITNVNDNIIDFQLSIDGKLYFLTQGNSNQLGVINCPDKIGGNSNIQEGVITFSQNIGNIDGFAPQPNFFFQPSQLQLTSNATEICLGDTVELSALGGGINNFSWTPNATLIDANTLNPKAIPTETTTYTISASNLCGNNFTKSITIEVTSVDGLNADSNSPLEAGETINLTASGVTQPDITYEWLGPNGFSSTEQNPSINNASFNNAGTYKVVATSVNGCVSDTATLQVLITGEITVSKIIDTETGTIEDVFCPEQEINLTYSVNPPVSFEGKLQLSDADGDFSNPSDISSQTFNQGNTSEETITLTLPSSINAGENYKVRILPAADSLYNLINDITFGISTISTEVATDTTLCNTDTYTLEANPFNPNESGFWEILNGEGKFAGDSTQAVVEVTELNEGENIFLWNLKRGSCIATDTLIVTVNLAKAELITGNDTTICQGNNVLLELESFENNEIQWYRNDELIENANSRIFNVDTSGVYYAVSKVNSSCADTSKSVTIQALPQPQISITSADTIKICPGDIALIQVDTLNSTSIQWQKNGENIDNSTSINLSVFEEGNYQAIVSNNICIDTSKIVVVKIETIQIPSINVADTVLFCQGSSVQLQADTIQGYNYQWQRDSVDIPNTNSPFLETNIEGNYRLVVNSNLCSDTSRIITVQSIPPLELSYPDSIVLCSTDTYSPPKILQDSLLSFLWFPEFGIDSTQIESPNFSLSTLQDTTVEYIVTVVNSETTCVAFDTMKISYLAKPIANAGGDTLALCEGDSIKLGVPALPNLVHEWNRAVFLSDSTVAEPIFSSIGLTNFFQTYVLQVTDTLTQCVAYDTVSINVIPKIELTLPDSFFICTDSSITISSSAQLGVKYSWSSSTPNINLPDSASIQFNFKNEGVKPDTVQLFLEAQTETCVGFDTTNVIVFPKPVVDNLSGNTSFCTDDVLQSYSIQNESNVFLEWLVEGGEILSQNDSSVTVEWDKGAAKHLLSASPTSSFGCNYLPQQLEVEIFEVPQPQVIMFSSEICEGEKTQTYQIDNSNSLSTYQWFFEGADIIEGQNTTEVTVNWTQNTGRFWVEEVSVNSCSGSSDTSVVVINPKPVITTADKDIQLCGTSLLNQFYSVDIDIEGIINWEISGGTITNGINSNQIIVDWIEGEEKLLKVNSISAKGCQSDTLQFNIFFENVEVNIQKVSVENQAISIELGVVDQVSILQRSIDGISWSDIATLNTTTTQFSDNVDINTSDYFYRRIALNSCGDSLFSKTHKTIFLEGSGNLRDKSISLNWTEYLGWSNSLEEYQVLQSTDKENFEIIAQLNSSQISYFIESAPFASEVCFLIRAIQSNTAQESNSNITCFTFNTDLVIPNVFTPNNDGHNDTWEIINVPPNSTFRLEVRNRWGEIVYETTNANQAWDGGNINAGTYFYQLNLNEETFKGWIKVLK